MTLVVLIGAVGLALLAVAWAVIAPRRARASADDRVDEAIRSVVDAVQGAMRAGPDAVEAPPPAARPAERFAGELAASLDLEEVADRTLEAASAIAGVEAVVVDAAAPEGGRITVAVGMPEDEISKIAVQIPENDNLRAVEVTYRYRLDDVAAETSVVRTGVAVPVRAEGARVGTLSAFTRSAGYPLGEEQIAELERLAFRAGPALENARRFMEARVLADLDALTGLHNRRFFHETLAREVARAHRYRRRLGLILFDLDDFKAVNDRIGHLSGDGVLAEIAARTMSVVRTADIACRVGGDEFGIVLPESGREDAELLAARISRAIGSRPAGKGGRMYLSAGVAELRDGDDSETLFERADEALYRAKELGKARTVAADGA